MAKYLNALEPLPDEMKFPIVKAFELLKEEIADVVTKKDFEELRSDFKELAIAQKGSEERLTRLETAVEKLAIAQKGSEEAVKELSKAVKNLAKQVGGLSEAFGVSLEDLSYEVLPACIEKYYGIEVESIGRDYVTVENKKIEINILGNGKDKSTGEEVTIIGEVKSNITKKEAEDFLFTLDKIKDLYKGRIFLVFFGYRIHPDAREIAKEAGVRMFVSYGKEIA